MESSEPTIISNSIYEIDGVLHHAADNTLAMFPFTVSKVFEWGNVKIIDYMIEENHTESLKM